MNRFIKVCNSYYGGITAIYHYVNPAQIISFQIVQTDYAVNLEATLVNGEQVIILHIRDLIPLVGKEEFGKIKKEIEEILKERELECH